MTENRTDREKMVSGVGEEEPGKIDDALLPELEGVFFRSADSKEKESRTE